MPKLKITEVSVTIGRSKTTMSKENIKHIEVSLSNKDHFSIEIDSDGDISITSNSDKRIKVVGQEENELVIRLIK